MEATTRLDTEKNEIISKLELAVEKAKDVCERLEQKTVAAAKATDKAVREHPYHAVGVAFGLGVLVGVLATRVR
jgi:ElaB/YqjD/DUF883 family membrane-anchored ribosome-binding protein